MSIFQDKRTESRKKEFPSLPSNRTDCDGLSIEEIIKSRVWVSKSDLKTWVSKYEIKLETLRSRGDHFKSITSVSVPYFGKHYPWTICQITDVLYLNIVLLLKKAQVQEARLLYSWTQFLMNCYSIFCPSAYASLYVLYQLLVRFTILQAILYRIQLLLISSSYHFLWLKLTPNILLF